MKNYLRQTTTTFRLDVHSIAVNTISATTTKLLLSLLTNQVRIPTPYLLLQRDATLKDSHILSVGRIDVYDDVAVRLLDTR